MTSKIKDKFDKQGFLIVRNVLDFNFDLKPVLNDIEFIMNGLLYDFVSKKNIALYSNMIFGKNILFYQN